VERRARGFANDMQRHPATVAPALRGRRRSP
jgi:hypothetical protein